MDSKKYIGMDVHQASISIAVRDASGKLVIECCSARRRTPASDNCPSQALRWRGE